MPQSKEVQREQARLRKGKQRDKESVTSNSVTGQGVTWETIPLEDIKSILPQDIVSYIENVGSRYGLREQRLRRAYKYQVWHEENFMGGIHKDSKYRQFTKEGE